jgi:uncharacterized protein YfbU (UPF0304 family)
MAVITIRVKDNIRDDLERLAQAHGTTVSELVREAIEGLVGARHDLKREGAPQTLSMVDRRTLVLLHKILDRVDDGKNQDSEDHQRQIKALERGFSEEYNYEFGGLEPELSLSESSLLFDILDMFTVLEACLRDLDEQAIASLGEYGRDDLTFAGFDANHPRESSLRSYARHVIKTGRWTSMAYHFDDQHERGNSHTQMLEQYQRMLIAYKSVLARRKAKKGHSMDAYRLDVNDLREVLALATT